MGALITYLTEHCPSAWTGRIWLDIEGTQYWLGDATKNQAWYQVCRPLCVFFTTCVYFTIESLCD